MNVSRRAFGLGVASAFGVLALGVPATWVVLDENAILCAAIGAFFPPIDGLPTATDVGAAENLARYLESVPTRTKWEVRGLLRAVELAPLASYRRRFTQLAEAERTAFLEGMVASSREANRLIVGALRQLCSIAYWQSPKTWATIGYDGPWVRSG